MAACRQGGVSHYVLPKFAKADLSKLFGVKRISVFALQAVPPKIGDFLLTDIRQFDQLAASESADIHKFRYPDDSMFSMRSGDLRNTLIKKWTVEIFNKNHKK